MRLEDVGHAELGALDERRVVRFNGKPAIALGVIKQATAAVAQEVQQILPSIRKSLPEGMEVRVANDKSVFIAESIKNVYHTIGEAIVLVVLISFPLPPLDPGDADPAASHSGLADRRLGAELRFRHHYQHADAARARHRPGGGRRHQTSTATWKRA